MTDNLLIPLPGFALPADYPWRVRFISAVDDQLRRLRASGHFIPSRFFGYYFQGDNPVGVSGSWTVSLEPGQVITRLAADLDRITTGLYSIVSTSRNLPPDFLLIHDRLDGACWLWKFPFGLRFVEAVEPVEEGDDPGFDGAEKRMLGP